MKNSRGYRYLRGLEQKLRRNIKRLRLKMRLRKATPVFIFQMGKVASSSIHYSLKTQYPGAVAHAHHIGPPNWASELFYQWFKEGNEIKIISPVRDPISRNVSSFFQKYSDYSKKEFQRLNLDTEQLIDDFIRQYPHDTPLTWFDDNIKKYFAIDIYASSFPENGIAVYRRGNASLLVFRVDLDDAQKEKAIREFLAFDDFRLCNQNVSSNKEYYQLYREFIATIKLPADYLDKMKASRFFNYFYRQDEIEKILEKWKL